MYSPLGQFTLAIIHHIRLCRSSCSHTLGKMSYFLPSNHIDDFCFQQALGLVSLWSPSLGTDCTMGASLIFSSWSCWMWSWNLLLWMSQTTADVQVLIILLHLVWLSFLAQGSEEPSLPRDIFPCLGEIWWLPTVGLIQILMEKVVVYLQLWVLWKTQAPNTEKTRVCDWATE